MALTSSDVETIVMIVSRMLRESYVPLAEHGIAVGGSWSAIDSPGQPAIECSTFQVTSGKTAAITGDDGDQAFARPRTDLGSTAIGDQFAPRGGERTVMVPTEEGHVAIFIHGRNDTNALLQAGERIIAHRNAAGTYDTHIHWTNDGKAAGDGLGGIIMELGAFAKLFTTSAFPANAPALIIDDASATVQIANSGTAAGDAVVRQSDLVALLAAIQTKLNTWASTNLQAGSGAAGPTTLTSINPTGSQRTFTG